MSHFSPFEDLLIEIGCEELPPKSLKKMQNAFVESLCQSLANAELSFKTIQGFATPRRLAIHITALSTEQPTRLVIKRGPAKNAAFDAQGNPTKAALGFAQSCGVSIDALSLQESDKGAWLTFKQSTSGSPTKDLIIPMLTKALTELSVGRRMRWGNNAYQFTRPIHWIVLLLGNQVIEAEFFGIQTGNLTRGHRFLHPNPILIPSPAHYETLLFNKGYVIADYDKRLETIRLKMAEIAKKNNYHPIIMDELLNEVTGLVEWPVVLTGTFDEAFLAIPKEALITSMQNHQKCFPIRNADHQLLAKFIIVSNLVSKDPTAVIVGNECVMRARLQDAVFYYGVDKEIPLANRQEQLNTVVFQAGLGTLGDKSKRIAALAKIIAKSIHIDLKDVERAALLCKTDLLTQMVGEFPELQGIMGRYYALHDKETLAVANAIEEHYYPRFSQDKLPSSVEGVTLSLADRIDTLVGLFGIQKRPTGDKDPFGLRRQALSALRILVEKQLDLDLEFLIKSAASLYSVPLATDVTQAVLDFSFERFRAWYQDQNVPARLFEAVYIQGPTHPLDFDKRIQAVKHFLTLPEAESLASANKRVQNIISKSNFIDLHDISIDRNLLTEEAEKNLAEALSNKEKEVMPLLQAGDYTLALIRLAALKEPIDQFFDTVMVMVEETNLRNNRLRLLSRLRTLFLKIADISLL